MISELKYLEEVVSRVVGIDIYKTRRKRGREYVFARTIYYRCSTELLPKGKASLTALGKSLGKNHATVYHALNNFERDILGDPRWAEHYISVMSFLRGGYESAEEAIKSFTEVQELKKKVYDLTAEIAKLKSMPVGPPQTTETRELLAMFNQMTPKDKGSTLFKMRTTLKVRAAESKRERHPQWA